ncbi:hypothetical protein [Nosocomiicoccus ampullae]|uniref:hypothetical protein n=1 Tax=Nosocomiicoccus ampullae TaxID=489910 RepID=UPI002551B99C|nr:hypothetical protein [Nosocomiicoccus ampullae]MDK6862686.1 hypothetical protein [Nosocomiicoccus ampullae]
MRNALKLFVLLSASLLLSACMYPQSERDKNAQPKESQIKMVENAVKQFQEDNDGLLPFKTTENHLENREYLQYQVDFNKLVPDYISDIPPTAFENGGHYQYVIIDEDTDPKVKIADLRITNTIRSLTTRLNVLSDHVKLGDMVGPNVYMLDLDHYHLDQNPTVTSPYTGNSLNVYFNGGEEFLVDYREDVQHIIDDQELSFKPGEDVRHVLYEHTPVVPIYSPELTVDENNNVIFMTSKIKKEANK